MVSFEVANILFFGGYHIKAIMIALQAIHDGALPSSSTNVLNDKVKFKFNIKL